MKFSLLFIIFLVFGATSMLAQNDYLELIKTKNGKVKTIKEGKRVRVVLLDGTAYKGILNISDPNGVYINEDYAAFETIASIQRNQLFERIAGIFLISAGGLTLGIAGIVALVDTSVAGTLALSSAGVIGGGFFALLLQPKHKNSRWTYQNILE